MIELFKSFEHAAGGLHPLVLIVPGLGMVALGLFVWLGGLGFRRALFALLGAAVGGIAALLIVNDNGVVAGASAMVGALFAAICQRVFTALLLGLLAVVVSFVIIACPHLREYHGSLIGGQDIGRSQTLTARDSLRVMRAYGLDLVDGLRRAAGRLTPVQWAAVAAATAGTLTLGVLFQSFGGALSCATLGTTMIFAGLLLLTIFKGSAPIGRLAGQPAFYGLVFVGMAVFGTLEQLTLCRRAEQQKPKSRSGKSPPTSKESKRSWRNR
ncbi:MAG: hypothetical protein JW955_01600 [Sedimentisphaerales bacterium]|nr:hypothetical protein [Sedimentisphaerales bacterium]